jgi:hypothetical protein
MKLFDIIGDVHGRAGKLECLFRFLGYQKIGGVYGSADRKAVFVGDLIDRGPAIGETLNIVKAMVDAGLTYRNYVFPANDVSPDIPIPAEMTQHRPYPKRLPSSLDTIGCHLAHRILSWQRTSPASISASAQRDLWPLIGGMANRNLIQQNSFFRIDRGFPRGITLTPLPRRTSEQAGTAALSK